MQENFAMTTETYSKFIDAIERKTTSFDKRSLYKNSFHQATICANYESKNEVIDLKERLLEQEKCSSKDTIIINNLPFLETSDLVS